MAVASISGAVVAAAHVFVLWPTDALETKMQELLEEAAVHFGTGNRGRGLHLAAIAKGAEKVLASRGKSFRR